MKKFISPFIMQTSGIALLVVMLFPFFAGAQVTDTLKEVRIKSKRQKERISADDRLNIFSPGQKITTVDSITLQQYQFQSIANLLTQQVPVFVKSYGMNGLATLNFRGASAAQSQVYWNGVPLQNAALGIADVSSLPVSLMNKVNIVYGGSSALWGSGNVGGALVIESESPAFDSARSAMHSVSVVAGSYGHYQVGLGSAFATRKLSLAVNAFAQTAENDFTYRNNGEEHKLGNSKMKSRVVMLQGCYKINQRNTLGLVAWYQQYYREIPPAVFEQFSVKKQRDESLRFVFDWKRQGNKTGLYAKLAYMRDNMLYNDTIVKLKSDNITNQFYNELGLKHRFNLHHRVIVYTPVHVSKIEKGQVAGSRMQARFALAAAYAFSHLDDRLNISVSARGEKINERHILLPGINGSYAVTRWLALRTNLQRSFRAPTLNELYYNPGGDSLLRSEKGWSQDAGYSIKTSTTRSVGISHDVSVFNRVIDDWIVWFGGAIWTPHNIAKVHSRGIETENRLQLRTGKWKFHVGLNSSYVLATTLSSYIPNDGSIGKQIPYTPRYNGQANIGFAWRELYFNYNQTYTGYRFVGTDESTYLLPYSTGNIQLLYMAHVGKTLIQVTGQCNNIWSVDYEVVAGRPMPRLNFLFGLKVSWANQ